ncbi:unnamed protein product [Staurois parvus]|uniref:Uncharacterized protein n=1 Tax=Staurois parvus TaxID=386267 RepID=A0ABN9D5F8_9NEOB|nr:unnamed protein product [Staurois parvus]
MMGHYSSHTDTTDGAPLVSVGGVVPHHWYQWEESCPIIGVSGRNSTPSLDIREQGQQVSVGGIVPHHWCH